MYPARWFYRKHEEEPTTEVAIRRGFAEDLYLVMPAFSVEEQSASMGIHVNPLVELGLGGLRRAGDRHRHRAAARYGLLVRAREPAGRRGDDVDAAAGAAAVALDAARAAELSRSTQKSALQQADRKRNHLHVRLPAAGRLVRHAELFRPHEPGSRSSPRISPKARITTRSSTRS